jgi:hypothetical protein
MAKTVPNVWSTLTIVPILIVPFFFIIKFLLTVNTKAQWINDGMAIRLEKSSVYRVAHNSDFSSIGKLFGTKSHLLLSTRPAPVPDGICTVSATRKEME